MSNQNIAISQKLLRTKLLDIAIINMAFFESTAKSHYLVYNSSELFPIILKQTNRLGWLTSILALW